MKPSPKRLPTRYPLILFDYLVSQGIDGERLLHMAGIGRSQFEAQGATLVPEQMEAFVRAARQLSGRTDLGFELGRLIKQNSHDMLGVGMLSCRNVDEMFRMATRHYHLMTETVVMRYRRTPTVAEAVYTPITTMPLEMLQFYLEALAVAHVNQVRLLFGDQHPGYDVYLSMSAPPHLRRYLALAPVRFHFDDAGMPSVRVVMPPALVTMTLPMADARVAQQIDERCGALARPPADNGDWGAFVTMMLREARGEMVTLEDLARRVSVSARTIDRHLKKENLQFRDLSQQVRFERARELLTVPGATVGQVALALGFSDAANFSRAFRREFGISPRQFQQGLSAPDGPD